LAQTVWAKPRVTVKWTARTTSLLGPIQHSATQVFSGEIRPLREGAVIQGSVGTVRAVLLFLAAFVFLASAGAQTLLELGVRAVSGHAVTASDLVAGAIGLVVFSIPLAFYRVALVPFARRDRRTLLRLLVEAAEQDDAAPITSPTTRETLDTNET
jgi:hypothetical protein